MTSGDGEPQRPGQQGLRGKPGAGKEGSPEELV